MPHMQNVLGDLFGGHLLAMVDQAAAVAAIRHAGGPAVTARIDRVDFRERIPVGALVTCCRRRWTMWATPRCTSRWRCTPRTSRRGHRRHTHTAHVVFVAIDEHGKPKRVPRLIPETPEEQERYDRARLSWPRSGRREYRQGGAGV